MTNLSFPSSVELISVHLPKTAGSTFGKVILPQIHPQNQILYDYDNFPINILIEQGKLRTETRVIHGHFPDQKYREYYPNTKMVIWLRNPINLLISAYYFLLNITD
jgi:Sulfotransferase domain